MAAEFRPRLTPAPVPREIMKKQGPVGSGRWCMKGGGGAVRVLLCGCSSSGAHRVQVGITHASHQTQMRVRWVRWVRALVEPWQQGLHLSTCGVPSGRPKINMQLSGSNQRRVTCVASRRASGEEALWVSAGGCSELAAVKTTSNIYYVQWTQRLNCVVRRARRLDVFCATRVFVSRFAGFPCDCLAACVLLRPCAARRGSGRRQEGGSHAPAACVLVSRRRPAGVTGVDAGTRRSGKKYLDSAPVVRALCVSVIVIPRVCACRWLCLSYGEYLAGLALGPNQFCAPSNLFSGFVLHPATGAMLRCARARVLIHVVRVFPARRWLVAHASAALHHGAPCKSPVRRWRWLQILLSRAARVDAN